MTSASVPVERPPSEQLVDLHVYLVPKEVWNEKYHCAYNDVIHQTISAGFLRVWPELSLYYLRNQIIDQLGYDVLPSEYVFLKSVGRCLTQVKSKQEFELKVKNFIPPQVPLPEIFVLEAERDALHLASFTNHERVDIIEEESFSTPKEEPTDMDPCGMHQAVPPDTQSAFKPPLVPLHVRPRDVGIQHAVDQPSIHSNHLPDTSNEIPVLNQSPRSMRHHRHSQSPQATHEHHTTNTNHSHSTSDHVHLYNSIPDHPNNSTPRSTPRLPPLLTHRSSQTNQMPDLITANSRMSSVSCKPLQDLKFSPTNTTAHTTTAPDLSRSPQQRAFASPKNSPPSPSNHGHPQLTPLPPHLIHISDLESSPNSSTNNSASSSGRISTIILPPEPIHTTNPGITNALLTNPHSDQQVNNVSPSSNSNPTHFCPSVNVSSSLVNAPISTCTNHQESSSSTRWAVPQSYSSFHNEHQLPTCDATPAPSQTPNVTPGGVVSPLHLQNLKAVKGMDPSTPLKSGRLDTYTNNTNEDSGIAEFTPDGNDLEYGRQRSGSVEKKQRDENHQSPRTFAINSRERPDSLDHRLQPKGQPQLDKVHKQHLEDDTRQESASAQVTERLSQREEREREERERHRAEREQQQQIKDEATRVREEKQRLLETELKRETERWEKDKEEERQRLLKNRQQELERRHQEVAAVQKAAAAAAAAAQEAAHQQRLRDEEEEREMEEEIRKRQGDELRQSRQMSWDLARQRAMEQFTPQSYRAGSSQQRDLYEPSPRDSVRREHTGDLLDRKFGGASTRDSVRREHTGDLLDRKFGGASTRDSVRREHTGDLLDRKFGGASTRQSERPQDDGALLAEDTGSGVATDGNHRTSAGATSDKTQRTLESAREKLESERERLLTELQERQEMRLELERTREEMMKQAKTLQSRTIDRRNKAYIPDDENLDSWLSTLTARDVWKKKYFEEKKKTNPLEDQVNRLRGQLDQQHRKLLNQLEGRGPNRKGMPRAPPSKKNDHKILIFKMQHQIDDLKRRVENSKMRLTSEIKLRNQAETELRNLRTDVLQRKINVTVSRSQQFSTIKELEEKQGPRTGATSYTPMGTLRTGLK